MRKSFKYRLYPTKGQVTSLKKVLEECRWLYNHFLDNRKRAWKEQKKQIKLYEQTGSLPQIKKDRPSLKSVHSMVLQDVGFRVE